ncbi:general substrate transporter [Dactylonectria macrodidyma]|uniref:General substrate transporter n=1 Tax=Dactylonectria macrodidyma TaxID=307937 RepID=A0A9P9ETC4_9HYPO|nr:general substrate transporter [Dactylonectria macrodidyma]
MSQHADDHKAAAKEAAVMGKSSESCEHVEVYGGSGEFDDSIEDTKPSRAVWFITITVAMGGFLFGYDTGVISAVLVTLKDDLGHELSSKEQELITSLTSGGALVGALIAGLPADKYGRKLGIYVGCFLFLVGSVIQAASFTVAQMSVGRFVVGLGVGSAAMIIPLYIGEIAPAKYRGRMISFDNMCVCFGQLISYALGAALTDVAHGWRWMVAIGGIPPIILAALLPRCPESPRQLMAHGKIDEARKVIATVYSSATEEQLKSKMDRLIWTVEVESQTVASKSLWWQFKQLHCVPSNLRALTAACAVMAVSQLGGFNTLMYYSATLFSLVGFNKPTAVAIVVGATNFMFNIVNLLFVDRIGRRILLLISVFGMSMSLVIAAVAFHYIPINKDLVLESTTVGWPGILVLVTIIFYVAFFATGVATIAWVGTEFLPLEVRALGTMMNTVTCWGCNIIIASTFLSMMKSMTPTGAFGFYAAVCFSGFLFIVFLFPECKGLPLEDVRQVFENGFNVKLAAQMQKDLKAKQKANENKA